MTGPIGQAPAGGMGWDETTQRWVPLAFLTPEVYKDSSDRYPSIPVDTAEETADAGGRFAGLTVPALKKTAIEPTTKLAPDNGDFTDLKATGDTMLNNLEITGDATFHGKVSFATAVHTKWFDASKDAGVNIVIDLANGPNQYVVLGENKNIWLPSVPDEELMFSLVVMQDATGSWKVTWMINGDDPAVDGMPIVYWSELSYSIGITSLNTNPYPVVGVVPYTIDMYSFTWMSFLNAGKGAYVAMATQNITHTGVIAL